MQAEESQNMEGHWGSMGYHWSYAINHLHETAHVAIIIHALISKSVQLTTYRLIITFVVMILG